MANGPQSRGDTYYGIDELSFWFPRVGGSDGSVKLFACPNHHKGVGLKSDPFDCRDVIIQYARRRGTRYQRLAVSSRPRTSSAYRVGGIVVPPARAFDPAFHRPP